MLSPAAMAAQPSSSRFIKGICGIVFPKQMPVTDYFAAAKKAGFDAIELRLGAGLPIDAPTEQWDRFRDAAEKAKVLIVSVWVSEPLSANPLNSPQPAVRARGVETLKRAIDVTARLGCDSMLVVPGRLGSGGRLDVGYEDTWNRVTEGFRNALPYAESKKVCLTPENVWNKFLVSPLEMRAFVDQFQSPWVQVHFDVGNIMQYGYPQDWILTLGKRIRRIHLKDYKLSTRAEQGRFVGLLEGDVDWKAVMGALVKTGYRGSLAPEYGHDPNDPDQLKKLSQAVDKILAMA